jgi:hypothetical protein
MSPFEKIQQINASAVSASVTEDGERAVLSVTGDQPTMIHLTREALERLRKQIDAALSTPLQSSLPKK